MLQQIVAVINKSAVYEVAGESRRKNPIGVAKGCEAVGRVMRHAPERIGDADIVGNEDEVKRGPEDHRQTAKSGRGQIPNVQAGDAEQRANGITPNVDQREEAR